MVRFPASVTRAAVDALGWAGEVVGPVEFAGVRFLAVVDPTDPGLLPAQLRPGRRAPWLVGALFEGTATRGVLRAASRLAAYAPRAVLVPERRGLTGFLVDAALLDQGVVVVGPGGVRALAPAGLAAPRGGLTAFDLELRRHVWRARAGRDGAPAASAQASSAPGSVTSTW